MRMKRELEKKIFFPFNPIYIFPSLIYRSPWWFANQWAIINRLPSFTQFSFFFFPLTQLSHQLRIILNRSLLNFSLSPLLASSSKDFLLPASYNSLQNLPILRFFLQLSNFKLSKLFNFVIPSVSSTLTNWLKILLYIYMYYISVDLSIAHIKIKISIYIEYKKDRKMIVSISFGGND